MYLAVHYYYINLQAGKRNRDSAWVAQCLVNTKGKKRARNSPSVVPTQRGEMQRGPSSATATVYCLVFTVVPVLPSQIFSTILDQLEVFETKTRPSIYHLLLQIKFHSRQVHTLLIQMMVRQPVSHSTLHREKRCVQLYTAFTFLTFQ